jgi:hypothetical protein
MSWPIHLIPLSVKDLPAREVKNAGEKKYPKLERFRLQFKYVMSTFRRGTFLLIFLRWVPSNPHRKLDEITGVLRREKNESAFICVDLRLCPSV